MHDLEMPEVSTGLGVGRNDTGAVQVVARTIAAEQISGGRAERHVNDAALGIHGHESPYIDSGALLPAVPSPGTKILFVRTRNRVEGPGQLAIMNIVSIHIA